MPVSLIEIYYTLFVIFGGVVLGISLTFGCCEYIAWRYPEWVVWTPNGEELRELRNIYKVSEYLRKGTLNRYEDACKRYYDLLESVEKDNKPDAAP